jgi:arabinose-5-phosphate isomerase
VHQEACPLGLAPTTSTTVMLAMGDAIALSVLKARGFTAEDFARSHPGGKLGRRLLLTIADIMHQNDAIPRVNENALLAEAVLEMSQKRLGFTTITAVNDNEQMLGIFTDGDLRRAINQNFDIHNTLVRDVMTKKFTWVSVDSLATEAVLLMEKVKTLVMPVLDHRQKLVGALNMHELFKAGIV